MIKLEVETYCQTCPEFEPDVEKDVEERMYYDSFWFDSKTVSICNTIVRCKHRNRCASIHDDIEKKIRKEQEKKNNDKN